MTAFPGSPKVLRGAIVGIDILNPLASVIVFQYNPDTLSRTLQTGGGGAGGGGSGGGGGRTEALRLSGPPVETIKADVEIDATDQLETGGGDAASDGIYPQLAALELLVYPKSALTIANSVLLALGTIEVVPPLAPFTVFIWGPKRVVPVKITDFTISEDAYDVNLNPIRAKVSLGLRVLNTNDLPLTHPGYALFLAHQVVKETLATIGSLNDVAAVAGANVKLV